MDIDDQAVRPTVWGSGYALPFGEGSFDSALTLSVLEHLENPAEVLLEIRRVLRPGGSLLVATPFAFPVHGHPFDFRRWTRAGLETELKAAGFEIVESRSVGSAPSSIVANWHFFLSGHDGYLPYRWSRILIRFAAPIILLGQALSNLIASRLDRFDAGESLPFAIVVFAVVPVSTK